MNRNDTSVILERLSKVYERFTYTQAMAEEWRCAFEKDSYKSVSAGIEKFIAANPTNAVPTIDRIKAYMQKRTHSPENVSKWYELRKWRWVMVDGEAKQREMYYSINHHGDIVDEYGRIYADSDEQVNEQLRNRVRATGRLF